MKQKPAFLIIMLMCGLVFCGCPPVPRSQTQSAGEEAEDDNQATEPEEVQVDPVFEEIAISNLEKLGFDRSTLEISNEEVVGSGARMSVSMEVDDTNGDVASVVVDANTRSLISIRFLRTMDRTAPEALQPGDDLVNRVASALGLEGEGYVREDDSTVMPDFPVFVRFEDYKGYPVMTGEIAFMIRADTKTIESINIQEDAIPGGFEVNVTEEEAIDKARALIGQEEEVVSQVRLIVMPVDFETQDGNAIVWEVTFDRTPVLIRADTGEPV